MTETCIFELKHTSFYSKMSHLVYDRIFSPSLPECTDNVTNSVSNFQVLKSFKNFSILFGTKKDLSEKNLRLRSLTNSNNKLLAEI